MKYKNNESLFTNLQYDKLSILITLFFLLISLFVSNFLQVPVSPDSFTYLNAAKAISMGKSYEYPFQPPGFSFLISVFGKYLYFDYFNVGKSISIMFSTIFIYFVYIIIKNVFNDKKIALYSQALVATNSIILLYSILPLTDMMFASILYISIYYIIKNFDNPPYSSVLIAGIFSGLAYLTRYLSLILILSIILLFIILSNTNIKKKVLLMCIYFISFILTASPWLIINFLENGSPFHNHLYMSVAFDIYGHDDYNLFDEIGNRYNSLTDVVLSNPKLFILHWLGVGIVGFIIIFCFSIYLFVSKLYLNKKLFFIFNVLSLYFIAVTIGHLEKRYLIPLIPLAIAISVYSFLNLQKLQDKYRIFYLIDSKVFSLKIKTLIIICFIILNISSGMEIIKYLQEQPIEHKEAGNFLKNYGNPSERVIGYYKYNYYAQMKNLGMPEDLLNISNIDYIIYDEKFYAYEAPQFRHFLDPTNKTIPSNFKLIYYRSKYPKIAIYKISPTLIQP